MVEFVQNFMNGNTVMIRHLVEFVNATNRGIGNQREMNSRIRHHVGMDLIQIHIEGIVESQRGRDGAAKVDLNIIRKRNLTLTLAVLNSAGSYAR